MVIGEYLYLARRTPPYLGRIGIKGVAQSLAMAVEDIPCIVQKLHDKGLIGRGQLENIEEREFFVSLKPVSGAEHIYLDTMPEYNGGYGDSFYRAIAINKSHLLLQSIENSNHWNITEIDGDRFEKINLKGEPPKKK